MINYAYFSTLASGSTSTAAVSPTDWATVITDVTSQFGVSNIVGVISSVVVAGIGFVFLWWGVRLAFRSIMGAVKNGTLSINAKRGRRR